MFLLRIFIFVLLTYKIKCCSTKTTTTVAISTTSTTKSSPNSFSLLSTITKSPFYTKIKKTSFKRTNKIKNKFNEFTTSSPETFGNKIKTTNQQIISLGGNTSAFAKRGESDGINENFSTKIISIKLENKEKSTSEYSTDFSSQSFLTDRLASNTMISENSQFTKSYRKSKSIFDLISSASSEDTKSLNVSSTQSSLTDETQKYTNNYDDSSSTELNTKSKSTFSFLTSLFTNFPSTTSNVVTPEFTKETTPINEKSTTLSTQNRNKQSSLETETPKTKSVGTTVEDKISVSSTSVNYIIRSNCPYVSDILIYSLSGFIAVMGIITFVLIIIAKKINKPTISNYSANLFGFEMEESKNF